MNVQRGKLVSGGRLQIPADVRRQLGLSDGDAVRMRVVDGELRVVPYRQAIARVQARLKATLTPSDVLMSDELIAERRAEAARE